MNTLFPHKISIIIPVYQAETYLAASLDSVLCQTYTNWELLLIDDGSADRSASICDAYAQKDSRITVFHRSNQGVGAARNFGIRQATGEYLLFIDADDLVTPDYLEKLWHTLPKDSRTAISLCQYQLLTDGTASIRPESLPVYCQEKDSLYDLYLTPLIIGTAQGSCWRVLYPADLLKNHNIRFSSCKIAEDQLFFMEVLIHCSEVCVCPEALYIYRQDANSSSHRLYIREYLPNRIVFMKELDRILQAGSLSQAQYRFLMAYAFLFCRMLLYINATASPNFSQELKAIDESIFGTQKVSPAFSRDFPKTLKRNHKILNLLVNSRQFWAIRWIRSRKRTQ